MNRCGLCIAVLLVAGAAVAAAGDVETSYQNLQEAVAKKDVEAVKQLAAESSALARQEIAKPAESDPEALKSRLEYLRVVDSYADYALYSTAVQSPAPVMVDLIATLEQLNPKSKYLDAGYGVYLAALAKTGAAAKVPGIAEKGLANFPQNPDLLFYMANSAANHGQADRELTFSGRIIALWSSHPKPPEGIPAADWDRTREATLGPAYYMAGMVEASRQSWMGADRDLRAALPYAKGNSAMESNVLLQLGIANYTIGKATMNKARVLEAVKFTQQCAAVPGPNAQQAWHNVQVMKADADRMR